MSTLPASARERRFALAVVLASLLLFLLAIPYARIQLPHAPVFIAIYQSILAICDLITMLLLLGQFNLVRSRGLLVLAGGYLFTALIAVVHGATFPGLFATGGLLGAGPQSTAWLYMFWHAGFPLAVLYYAWDGAGGPKHKPLQVNDSLAVLRCLAAALGLVLAVAALALLRPGWLPAVMDGNHYTTAMTGVVTTVWLFSVAAVAVQWRRRHRSVLDVWLLVVMCAWVFDIGLSAVFNGGRYDLGFYAGRIYGLAASSFVLVVLLLETFALYWRLAQANDQLRDLANHDGLTGLFNRRHLDEQLELELARCRRERQQIALLLVDVDWFKQFNDRYGHLAGDACLRQVAQAVARTVRRPGDVAARYGGEEFAVLLPNTAATGAEEVARQIQTQMRACALPHADGKHGRVTVSMGVASCDAQALPTAQHLINLADHALYAAKAQGRDMFCVAGHEGDAASMQPSPLGPQGQPAMA